MAGFFSLTLDTSELRLVAITIAVAWITRKHGTTTHRLRKLGGRMQSRKRYVRELPAAGM